MEASTADSLVENLRGNSLAVVCHDNPDPDCIASALGLRALAYDVGVDEVDIYYGGEISHQENRAFVNLLDVELKRYEDGVLDGFDRVAFVDHAVKGQNNQVPASQEVDVVVDHHPPDEEVDAGHVDVREGYGATTTIVVEYLRALEVEVESDTATALTFGIRSETLGFIRDTTENEYEAARYLHSEVDGDKLVEMTRPAFSPGTMDAIAAAITEREIRASALASCVGVTSERDALPQAADYLMQLEGVSTVLVFGIVDDVIQMSARSDDTRVDVDSTMREAFGDVGSAGGHVGMAGAQVPLGVFSELASEEDRLVELVRQKVSRRFFRALNLEEEIEEETEEEEYEETDVED
ncbi:MAG: DHH family phosphoesterase [Halobacteriales archaeon]